MDPLIISSVPHRDRCFLFSWHKLCGSLAHLAPLCCYNGSFPSDVMLQFLTASTGRQYYHLVSLKDTSLILQNLLIHPGKTVLCYDVLLAHIYRVCVRMGNWYQWHDLPNIIVMASDKVDTRAKIWKFAFTPVYKDNERMKERLHKIWPFPCTHGIFQGFCKERKPVSMNFINKIRSLSH